MAVRYRYGAWRVRQVARDEDGKRHWLERGPYSTKEAALIADKHMRLTYKPKSDPILTDLVVSRIFDRFPSTTPYRYILMLGYFHGVSLKDAYKVSEEDVDGSLIKISGKTIELEFEAARAIHERIKQLIDIQLPMKHKTYDKLYLAVSNTTGKRLSIWSMQYVTKVIRMEICPNWSYEKFRK